MLINEKEKNEIEEQKIQESLYKSVMNHTSFRFNAGAGAGKTYALVEVLKFLLSNNLNCLSKRNQNIYCVTYTNVAVNEIKERLGNSDVIIVSTIHEMLWKLIKQHQPELLACHLKKLRYELEKLNNDLNGIVDENKPPKDKNPFQFYLDLKDKQGFEFFLESTKEIFYKNQSANSESFKKVYNDINPLDFNLLDLNKYLKNIANFKKVAKAVYKRNRYKKCIEKIMGKVTDYTEVFYDNLFNSDRLDKMRFSHDTLIEYAKVIIGNSDILKRIIIDKYPFVFIDEYQDTSIPVVEIMADIHQYAIKNNRNWVVGYFGDTAQNIYDDGVGSDITRLHSIPIKVNKSFNRRSHKQIVDIANKVRNDEIQQVLIDNEKNKGIFNFYQCDFDGGINNSLLKEIRDKLSTKFGNESVIDFFVLTNKLLANLSGFGTIYNMLEAESAFYFKDFNSQLISHELNKLNPSIRKIFNFTNMYIKVKSEGSTYYDIFGDKGRELKLSLAKDLIVYIKKIKVDTLRDLIDGLSRYSEKAASLSSLHIYLESSLGNEIETYNDLYSKFRVIVESLMKTPLSHDEDNNDRVISFVEKFLSINISEWKSWVNYINRSQNSDDIRCHTYHATKGEEYENVVIIMEHSFGSLAQNRNKFKNFFEIRGMSEEEQLDKLENMSDNDKKEFFNTQNLVYVACSRAIKNLAILYLDDISEIKDGLENIFGEVQEWPPQQNKVV
ncbi:UvrD-helicase domain-containing protein [Providencia sp. PROV223]|uniref:UvrD-helicase domain-containing protein n=1 Tax=Providencia sp. PROV223 TaxID=2949917 RepID=UPI00234B1298|nr:UvrD-helicase domain-containing protein [Providencia sp. PROV223]